MKFINMVKIFHALAVTAKIMVDTKVPTIIFMPLSELEAVTWPENMF